MLHGVIEYCPSVLKERNLSFICNKNIIWKFHLRAPGYVAINSGGLE